MIRRAAAMRWVLAYTLAVTGDATYFVVLTWTATRAGGALWSGTILAAGSIPRSLLMLPGGVLADRVDPRRLVLGTDAARCAVMVLAAALAGTLGLIPGWLLGVAVIFGVVDAVFMPAVGAMPAHLVAPEDRRRLQAWRIAGLRVSNTVGPAVGGLLISLAAPAAFAVVAVLFAGSVALLISVRSRATGSRDEATEAPTGMRVTLGQLRAVGVGRLVIAIALSEIPFSGPVAVGIVLLVRQERWAPITSGVVLAAFSLGGLAASSPASLMPTRLPIRAPVLGSTSCTALLLCAIALVPTAPAAVALGAALGLTTGITMVLCHGQIQQSTPAPLLGRVTALVTLLTLGVSPLLFAGAGALAATVGVGPFFYSTAVITLVATFVFAGLRIHVEAS